MEVKWHSLQIKRLFASIQIICREGSKVFTFPSNKFCRFHLLALYLWHDVKLLRYCNLCTAELKKKINLALRFELFLSSTSHFYFWCRRASQAFSVCSKQQFHSQQKTNKYKQKTRKICDMYSHHKHNFCFVYISFILLQVLAISQCGISSSAQRVSIIQCLRLIVQTEGSRALFKGLGPNIVGVAPSRAIYFCAYSQTKAFLNKLQ